MTAFDTLIINETLSIPASELDFRFSTSGGPGGQHANKAETRVVLLFDIPNSPSLTEEQRSRLLKRLASRLDSDGVLQVSVHETRSQHQNREIAIGRFQLLLADALREPKRRRKTYPGQRAMQRRLDEKRKQSARKRARRWRWEGE